LIFLAGCGASYEIVVVDDEFANMRTVNQHRLVSEALSKQLPNIHAIRIFTGTDEKKFLDS
jgi:stress-induced morphogen